MLESLERHYWPEVGAANADVDDIANPLSGIAFPRAIANAIREFGHSVEHFVDLRHDILAIDEDSGFLWRAKGRVKHGALFGDVDFVAFEHGVDPLFETGLG